MQKKICHMILYFIGIFYSHPQSAKEKQKNRGGRLEKKKMKKDEFLHIFCSIYVNF